VSTLIRNNVNVIGTGTQPMMFAHGFGCDQNMWRLITPAFEDDFKLILFDHVGAGGSDLKAYDPAKYASLQGYASDVLEICHEFELDDVIFVGHSVSAMIGVLAAKMRPDLFSHLILVGPSPRYIDDANYVGGFTRDGVEELLQFLENNHLGWSAAMAPAIMGNPDRPELSAELENSFCSTDPEIARQFARVTFLSDNRADLKEVTTPTLVLQCSEDVIAPYSVGDFCRDNLANSRLIVLRATGHCPHLSSPEETVAAIKLYLAGKVGQE
jgi:sigma-B regulation protein RsbQ